jgi:hypothetical protein
LFTTTIAGICAKRADKSNLSINSKSGWGEAAAKTVIKRSILATAGRIS